MRAYDPSLIAIDGLEPYVFKKNRLTPDQKFDIWTALPGRPSHINHRDHIYVLMGDMVYGEPKPNRPISRLLGLANGAATIGAGAGLGYAAGTGLDKLRQRSQSEEQCDADSQQEAKSFPITRRVLLTNAGIICGGLALTSLHIGAASPWQPVTDVANEIAVNTSLLSPNQLLTVEQNCINGRTAY